MPIRVNRSEYFDGQNELKKPPNVSAETPKYRDPREQLRELDLGDYQIPDLLPFPDGLNPGDGRGENHNPEHGSREPQLDDLLPDGHQPVQSSTPAQTVQGNRDAAIDELTLKIEALRAQLDELPDIIVDRLRLA